MLPNFRPQPPQAAASIDLDLAFSAESDLEPELVTAAGPWCAPLTAEAAWQQLLASWLAALQAALPPRLQSVSYSLGLSLVSDSTIAKLNSDWRQIPGPTDVLAFAANDEGLDGAAAMPIANCFALGNIEMGEIELGDIVISLPTAARQAPEHGNSLEQELLFLASHGLLHLLGWDHPDDAGLTAMLHWQDALCSRVNLQPSGSVAGQT